jgi:hypothetical protein
MALTEKELALTSELRDLTTDILEGDYEIKDDFLIKWIRYKNHDVKKAEQALRGNKKWKQEMKIDSLLEEKFPDLEEFLPIERPGFDKEGCPILAVKMYKDMDVRKIINAPDGKERVTKYMLQQAEIGAAAVKKQHFATNGKVNQVIFVISIEFSPSKAFTQLASGAVISTFSQLVTFVEDNYPGIIKAIYVINAPRSFKIVLAIVKPFVSADTVGRLRLYGTDQKEWTKALLEIIRADQLPSFAKISNSQ